MKQITDYASPVRDGPVLKTGRPGPDPAHRPPLPVTGAAIWAQSGSAMAQTTSWPPWKPASRGTHIAAGFPIRDIWFGASRMNNMRLTARMESPLVHPSSTPWLSGYRGAGNGTTHALGPARPWHKYNIDCATACFRPGPTPHPNPPGCDAAAAGYPWRPIDGPGLAGRAIRPWEWLGC